MPAPCDENSIVGVREPNRLLDRVGARRDLEDGDAPELVRFIFARFESGQHVGANLGWVLAVGVVVGDDDDVGVLGRHARHDGPLARVALPCRAKHDDEAPGCADAQGVQREAECVGVVREVDHDARIRTDDLHAAGHGRIDPRVCEGALDCGDLDSALDRHGERESSVRDVEGSGQRDRGADRAPVPVGERKPRALGPRVDVVHVPIRSFLRGLRRTIRFGGLDIGRGC